MMERTSDIIIAILVDLSGGPKTLEALVAETSRAIAGADESVVLAALERLIALEIVGRSPTLTPAEFKLYVSLETLAPLLKSLGRDPWRRLTGWRQKLSSGEVVARSAEVAESPSTHGNAPQTGYYIQEVLYVTDRNAVLQNDVTTFGAVTDRLMGWLTGDAK